MTPGPQPPMGRGDPPDIHRWLQCPCTLPGPPGGPQTSPPSPLTRIPGRPPPPPRGPEEHRFPRLPRAASPCPGTCPCAAQGRVWGPQLSWGLVHRVGDGEKAASSRGWVRGYPAQLCGKRRMRLLKKWCYPRRAAMAEVICVLCTSLGRKPALTDSAWQVRAH